MMASNDDAVAMLIAMGFDASLVPIALENCNGDVQAAADYLLSGKASVASEKQEASTLGDVQMVQGSMNQYSVEAGQSACTCVALTAAEIFLSHEDPVASVNAEFLQHIIQSGVETYHRMKSKDKGGNVEHLSAEEILQKGFFSTLQLFSGIKQGILSRDPSHPQGLRQQLSKCQSKRYWTCVLITKTPETVLVCLSGESGPYILIDSHPRPQQFGAKEAYARIHASFDDLIGSLEQIFPVVELGPDIPELMAAMYNSFDLYPFQRKGA